MMKEKFELIVVIPCFNEATRISSWKLKEFSKKNAHVLLYLINDGSKDDTEAVLHNIAIHSRNTKVLTYRENKGKATAVRKGFLAALENYEFERIAYLDADLSTSLEECYSMSQEIDHPISFVFGSRIAKLDSRIKRRFYRFFIGRIIATFIAGQLGVRVYDTQCGCKVFTRELAQEVIQEEFISTWLFDVEIFHRLICLYGKSGIVNVAKEIPLKSWIDKNKSRVNPWYFFRVWYDLFAIRKKYGHQKPYMCKTQLSEVHVR